MSASRKPAGERWYATTPLLGNSSFYLLPAASPLPHIDWHQPGITRFLADGDGSLRKPRLRQGDDEGLLVFLKRRLAALNRPELPALKILTLFEPKHGLGRLIDKNAEPGVIARDGADQ